MRDIYPATFLISEVFDLGLAENFEKEKLIMGVIFSDRDKFGEAMKTLRERFGETDFETEEFSFSEEFSNYYDEEVGGEARRIIFSFERCVDASLQAEIKTYTNALEAKLSKDGKRQVNLDPGFLSHGRLMLATTKKTGFRIPLSDGIYTELTLYYARGAWQKLPWTYRDYQSERVQSFLTTVRKKYLEQRKEAELLHPSSSDKKQKA